MRLLFLTTSVLALGIGAAGAADLVVLSHVASVTVYPDGANVARVADFDVPAGEGRIVFKGLPLDLDKASLRIEAEGSGRLAIGSLETREAAAEAAPPTDIDARLKALRDERATLQVTLDTLAAKQAMIEHFAEADPNKMVLDGKPMDVGHWQTAWDTVAGGLRATAEDRKGAQARAAAVDADIAALIAIKDNPPARVAPALDVAVAVEADAAVKGHVTLSYRVSNAHWVPAYDARLDTQKGSLALVRRALVTQQTGEPWADVALTLSTLSVSRGTAPPELASQQVGFVPVEDADETVLLGRRFHAKRAQAFAAPAPAPPMADAMAQKPQVAAVETEAPVVSTAYAATFSVPGAVSVANDGSQRSFRLATQTIAPTVTLKTVPALDPTAYLSVSATNDAEAPLLPGAVSLVRDTSFVGTGAMKLVAPGERFELGFGADEAVKVTRTPVSRKENDPLYIGQTKTEAWEYKTSVKNLHAFPVTISVLDRIPVSEVTTLVVEQIGTTTTPTEKIVGDKRGVMGWTYTLKPQEAKDIRLAYRMRWPADHEVTTHE